MNWGQFVGTLEVGLIYSLVALGIYLSFRVLRSPDLTVDGTFPLGAAVNGFFVVQLDSPFLALMAAVVAGGCCGWVTALLSTRLKILNILSGIIMMSALYSVNLRVMGNKANLSLLGRSTVFTWAEKALPLEVPVTLLALLVFVLLAGGFLFWFLKTELGLAMRAAGSNPKMARAQGVNDERMMQLGLFLSNGLVALAGALFSQLFGFADVSLGVGTVVVGLASVILGEALLSDRTIIRSVFGCAIGAMIYRLLIAFALNIEEVGLQASDLNLVTGGLIVVAMNAARVRNWVQAWTIKAKLNGVENA